ncbi:TetR/AcrR family transcriptional regulator [Compostimonas suwonensis]|uniref:TetR/AcrR family transcriptional regulator n=1 Tax=Compostimonas suwonensis TaxID=1048394 RepID=UPI0012FE3058|nr:TetR/AcrR family transcriptional regulator [Compostimonas suwonensis]
MAPDVRRAEIIDTTMRLIAEDGPHGLSLRSVARRCEMSAPGLMHHFPTLRDLLRAVVEERARIGREAIAEIVREAGDGLTLQMLADALIRFYYTDKAAETRNFDALEAESLAPGHPAHGIYPRSAIQPLPITRRLAERDFEDPDAALTMLSLLADALRSRWLRDLEPVDRWNEWVASRDHVFGTLERRHKHELPAPDTTSDTSHPDNLSPDR